MKVVTKFTCDICDKEKEEYDQPEKPEHWDWAFAKLYLNEVYWDSYTYLLCETCRSRPKTVFQKLYERARK